jgi:hypothetical protein
MRRWIFALLVVGLFHIILEVLLFEKNERKTSPSLSADEAQA